MQLDKVLRVAIKGGASDVIMKVGSKPRFRYQGQLITLKDGEIISTSTMEEWLRQVLPSHLFQDLEQTGGADFSYSSSFGGRFRVNAFKQMGQYGFVMRVILNHIRTIEELQLAPIFSEFARLKRGLVLVTGATGSGKTTTLAAMIDKVNRETNSHIITIEDPIEYDFTDIKSTINQREVGIDVDSFSTALKASLRQNPDVILVGELRDKETVETAINAAETGHLVLSTLHTNNAVDTMTRLLSYFSENRHAAIRNQLAHSLNAVIAQRLVNKQDGSGLIPAFEIMVVNSFIKDVILRGETFDSIDDAIAKGNKSYGMMSFDQSLLSLYQKGVISGEEALKHATSKDNLRLQLSGVS